MALPNKQENCKFQLCISAIFVPPLLLGGSGDFSRWLRLKGSGFNFCPTTCVKGKRWQDSHCPCMFSFAFLGGPVGFLKKLGGISCGIPQHSMGTPWETYWPNNI